MAKPVAAVATPRAFLLGAMSRHRLFGVDGDNYFPRIRGLASL